MLDRVGVCFADRVPVLDRVGVCFADRVPVLTTRMPISFEQVDLPEGLGGCGISA